MKTIAFTISNIVCSFLIAGIASIVIAWLSVVDSASFAREILLFLMVMLLTAYFYVQKWILDKCKNGFLCSLASDIPLILLLILAIGGAASADYSFGRKIVAITFYIILIGISIGVIVHQKEKQRARR